MSTMFILGLILILAFSFSISTYVIHYKIGIQNLLTRLISITVLGVIVAAVTFTISLIIVWPPVM